MSLSILNNITAMQAENQLNLTNTSLQNTLLELSSGSKLNSGADDAAGLSIANGLTANITALTQSSTNASDATGRLQVADGALSQVTSLLNRAVTLATESASDTVSDGSQRAALNNEYTSIMNEINSIGSTTTFNGSAVFAGGSTNYGQVVLGATAQTTPTPEAAENAGLATTVSGSLVIDVGSNPDSTPTAGAPYQYTFAAGTGATVGSMIDQINSSGDGLVASLNSTGNLVVTDTQNRATDAATAVSVDSTSTFQTSLDAATTPETGDNPTNSSTFNVYLSDGTSAGSSNISTTLGALSSDNLNGISLGSTDLLSASDSQSALTSINNAIAQVAALRGDLGASMNQLTAAGNVITTQLTNLTSAEDNVSSADISQQVSNMSQEQVLVQTGISALSQANQMQQALLKLLQ
jgi:flagellin